MAPRNDPVLTALAIDDDESLLQIVAQALALDGLEILTTTDPSEALDLVRHRRPRVVLLDLSMPRVHGLDLLSQILEADPGVDVLILSGNQAPEVAAEAIKRGAADFLPKPPDVLALRERMGKLVEEVRKRQRTLRLEHELLGQYCFEGLVGRSTQMLDLFDQIVRIGPHFQTVLVTGATGTGKELAARALHRRSPVASGPFIPFNCSAIVETLFESELFGHVKGSFTGATQDKMGLFEAAHHGTLFLDEVGDMPLATQAKLLRVLQTREVQRVGSHSTRKVEVRVVAATNRDLRRRVEQKEFREDLFHRLCVLELKMPSLAERKEDLPLLVRHFLQRFSAEQHKGVMGLTRRTQRLLMGYSWPGNVRELENVLRHAFVMAEGKVIDVPDLPERFRTPATPEEAELLSLDAVQRQHARRVMKLVGGNKVKAAKVLGVSRATLYRLLSEEKPEEEKPAE